MAFPDRRAPEDRRAPDPLEQGLDRLVSAGRQLVDGVSGARPAGRAATRPGGRRAGALPRLDGLGRWVEDKLDWILEDEDNWREPWQEPRAARPGRDREPLAAADRPPPVRRPLEAISRRRGSAAPSAPPAPLTVDDWPEDDSFTLARWQRPAGAERAAGGSTERAAAVDPPAAPGRPLPRSTRRRPA